MSVPGCGEMDRDDSGNPVVFEVQRYQSDLMFRVFDRGPSVTSVFGNACGRHHGSDRVVSRMTTQAPGPRTTKATECNSDEIAGIATASDEAASQS